MKIQVTRIIEEWDMRKRHALRHGKASRALGAREAIVAINRRKTIARIIDSVGGSHDYYTEDGARFDTIEIRRMVSAGFSVDLDFTNAKGQGKPAKAGRKAAAKRYLRAA